MVEGFWGFKAFRGFGSRAFLVFGVPGVLV